MDNTEEQAQVTNPAAIATPTPAPNPVIVDPSVPPVDYTDAPAIDAEPTDILSKVSSKIAESRNILIALSADPSVDEMSAAIGLSLYLDRLGKRATAIYSGMTPNALEFLKPEETFEPTADTLQDFVIALNKEKADHLRYKLDGDFVKVFITPYKTRIAEEDLEFSYGDFNVDLVLALDVANGIDLDSALREHGRIMHDAVIINITTGKPGKFGEIEWSDPSASSVSEMIATLLYAVGGKVQIEKEEATAFLTGIVAATNRFANAATFPNTMRLASRLMESGANQQLVAKNITPDIDNELIGMSSINANKPVDTDPTKLDIEHAGEEGIDGSKVVEATVSEKESTLLDELKAAEASLSQAGAEATPESRSDLFKLEEDVSTPESVISEATETSVTEAPDATMPEPVPSVEPIPSSELVLPEVSASEVTSPETLSTEANDERSEKIIAPSTEFSSEVSSDNPEDYSKMLEDALTELGGASVTDVNTPIMSSPDEPTASDASTNAPYPALDPSLNPALANTPTVPAAPEINGVPEMNYMPMPGEEVLPPPPAPPIDVNAPTPSPAVATAMPAETPAMPEVGPQPVMVDQTYIPQATDPSAFKIPGA